MKIFLLFSTLQIMIEICGKTADFPQKNIYIKKLPIIKVKSFLMAKFDVHQICKTMITQKH